MMNILTEALHYLEYGCDVDGSEAIAFGKAVEGTPAMHPLPVKGSNLLLALAQHFLYPRHLVSELLIF